MTVLVLGSVVVKNESLVEALAHSREHVARSLKEPGCIAHAVHQDAANPLRLVFVEEWADAGALAAHFKVPASLGFVKALGQCAAAPPAMKVYDARELRMP